MKCSIYFDSVQGFHERSWFFEKICRLQITTTIQLETLQVKINHFYVHLLVSRNDPTDLQFLTLYIITEWQISYLLC